MNRFMTFISYNIYCNVLGEVVVKNVKPLLKNKNQDEDACIQQNRYKSEEIFSDSKLEDDVLVVGDCRQIESNTHAYVDSPRASHDLQVNKNCEDINTDLDELPVFANNQNKELFLKIKEVERKIKQTKSQTEEHLARCQIMNDHDKHIKQDIDHTNHLLDARKKEIETENHLNAILEREKGRLKKELKDLRDNECSLTEEISIVETKIHNATSELDTFKESMSWNQKQLEQWVKSTAEKEDENVILQKYSRIDEVKIKELHLSIEKMTDVIVKKRADVQNIATEAQTIQSDLDRTSEIFQQEHNERRRLIQQWQDTIFTIRDRDKEINEVSLKYAETKKTKVEKLVMLEKTREDIILEQANIEDETQAVKDIERNLQTRRQERSKEIQKHQEFCDEFDSLQNELTSITSSLHDQNESNKHVNDEILRKEENLKKLSNQLEEAEKQFKSETYDIAMKENKAKNVEKKVLNREAELKLLQKDIQKLKKQLFHEHESLRSLKETQDMFDVEINNSQSQLKTLSARIRDLMAEDVRHQGLEYNAKYQLHRIERKVARGLGERSDEEQEQLKKNIERLELEVDKYKSMQIMLTKQNRSLQQELRAWQKQKQLQESQLDAIKHKIVEIELEISSCEHSLKSQTLEKEDLLILHDTTRVDMMRLRDRLTKNLNDVFDLKRKREILEVDISKKKNEFILICEVKTAELRSYEDDRHKNSIELAQRKIVSDKLRSKYEVLTKSSGDAGDPNQSHIHKMIIAAQKQEELQREGDELDRQIQMKEKEMYALEKTLNHLQEQNTKYRKSFSKVDKNSSEARQLESLRNELRVSKDDHIRRRFELRDLRDEYSRLSAQLSNANREIEKREIEYSRLQLTFRQSCLELEKSQSHFEVVQEELQQQVHEHRKRKANSYEESSMDNLMKMSVIEENLRAPQIDQEASSILEILEETVQEFSELKEDYEDALVRI